MRVELSRQQKDTHQQELEAEKGESGSGTDPGAVELPGYRETRVEDLTVTKLKLTTELKTEEKVSEALLKEKTQLKTEPEEQKEKSLLFFRASN